MLFSDFHTELPNLPFFNFKWLWCHKKNGKSFKPNAECQNRNYLKEYSFTLSPLLHAAKTMSERSAHCLFQAIYLCCSHNARWFGCFGSVAKLTNSVAYVKFFNEETCYLSLFTLRDLSCSKAFYCCVCTMFVENVYVTNLWQTQYLKLLYHGFWNNISEGFQVPCRFRTEEVGVGRLLGVHTP